MAGRGPCGNPVRQCTQSVRRMRGGAAPVARPGGLTWAATETSPIHGPERAVEAGLRRLFGQRRAVRYIFAFGCPKPGAASEPMARSPSGKGANEGPAAAVGSEGMAEQIRG